jgi:hypothetical protein
VADTKAGVVGRHVIHHVLQLFRPSPGVAINHHVPVGIQIAHRLADVLLGSLDGDIVHRHLFAPESGGAPPGDLDTNGLEQAPATIANFDLAGHQLHLVKVVVQGNPQVFLAPLCVLDRDTLGDAITQAIGVADPLALYDLDRQILNKLAGGLSYYNVTLCHQYLPSFPGPRLAVEIKAVTGLAKKQPSWKTEGHDQHDHLSSSRNTTLPELAPGLVQSACLATNLVAEVSQGRSLHLSG